MIQRVAVLTAALILCSTLTAADDPTKGKPTVEVVSLSVSKKLDPKIAAWSSSATMLSLQVIYPGKQFLGVDPSSSVTEFKDDKGNSLMGSGFFKTQFSTTPNIGKDRTGMVVYLQGSSTAPGKDATKILLKGQLVARCGTDEKATEEKEIELKLNTEVKAGDFTVKVTSEKGFAGSGASFSVSATTPIVKGVTFKDVDGKAVEASSFNSYGFGKTWTYNFTLKKEVKKGKIAVEYFSKEEKTTIPVDISAGVGL